MWKRSNILSQDSRCGPFLGFLSCNILFLLLFLYGNRWVLYKLDSRFIPNYITFHAWVEDCMNVVLVGCASLPTYKHFGDMGVLKMKWCYFYMKSLTISPNEMHASLAVTKIVSLVTCGIALCCTLGKLTAFMGVYICTPDAGSCKTG